jgi:pimeloyl-ACP methyl ester carboxylesterase
LTRPGAAVTLLVSHANAEDLNGIYPTLVKLAILLNVNVVGYDYSGYGGSTGTLSRFHAFLASSCLAGARRRDRVEERSLMVLDSRKTLCHISTPGAPSEADCYADIDCVHSYLVHGRGIPHECIVLYGRSLGSGPSCYLAQKLCQQGLPVAALILQAPIASVFRVVLPRWWCGDGAVGWPWSRMSCSSFPFGGDKFCNVDRMEDITCPVLIAHGRKDSIVPFWHGKALLKRRRVAADSSSSFAATASNAVSSGKTPCPSEAELFTSLGMHHNYWETASDEEKFVGAVNDFLDHRVLARQRCWTGK